MKRKVVITGGNGFVGRTLRAGLEPRGYEVDVFDRMRGPVVDFLRQRPLGTAAGVVPGLAATILRKAAGLTGQALAGLGAIRPSTDNILAAREALADRFRGSYAVVHLAGLPHPHVRGATPADFQRLNYDGSVNVFEAARQAGVPKFIFASSAQVYGINRPLRIDQFPILESNYCPAMAEGQNLYGFLKGEIEHYLERECRGPGIQSIAQRLEFPGVRSRHPWNFYISTSIENLVSAFDAAISADLGTGFDAFNVADREVPEAVVDIQQFLRQNWPDVPNRTTGNDCLLGTEKARNLLGYEALPGGMYYSLGAMW